MRRDNVDGVHLRDRITHFDAPLLASRGGHDRVELHGDRLELEVHRGGRADGDSDGLVLPGEANADNPHGDLARRDRVEDVAPLAVGGGSRRRADDADLRVRDGAGVARFGDCTADGAPLRLLRVQRRNGDDRQEGRRTNDKASYHGSPERTVVFCGLR